MALLVKSSSRRYTAEDGGTKPARSFNGAFKSHPHRGFAPSREKLLRHPPALRLRITVDPPLRLLVPLDVERPVGRIELHRRIRQVPVDPPREHAPAAFLRAHVV